MEDKEHHLYELKRLEWIFTAIRWLGVPVVFIMAWLHHPEHISIMLIFGVVLGLCNSVATVLNLKIKSIDWQRALGISMLVIDAIIAWGIISLFIHDFYTSAYAGFVFLIIEAAIRFGLIGSLIMFFVFILGLYSAFYFRKIEFGVRFSTSGFIFWTVVMLLVAVSVGIVVNDWKRQRRQSEHYLQENIKHSERQRIARELHDTVLKTLQGLAFEARSLGDKLPESIPAVKETVKYIEDVCARTSKEIREVIYNLRSESMPIGIRAQISKILDEWSQVTGILGEFTISGQDVTLPPEPARQVRNIILEALTNVQRHASASQVRVSIRASPDTIDVEISDNGCGIGRGLDKLHIFVSEGKLGLAIMKERVELLGGQFSLISNQSGTQVSFRVPVSQYLIEEKDNR